MKWIQVCFEQNHMATTFKFVVSCEDAQRKACERLLDQAHKKVSQLELELSEFLEKSPIYQLNQSKCFEEIKMPESAMSLIEKSVRLKADTQGAFNPTAKSKCGEKEIPEIQWDRTRMTAWKVSPHTHLGFGAIGKGFALDEVRTMIEHEGFENYYLSAGGSSIVFSGFASPPNNPWLWGWSWEKDSSGEDLGIPFAHATGKPMALGISGLHEKGNHLIYSLKKQEEAQLSAPKSALVATHSAADADALSTALFVSGWDHGQTFLNSRNAVVASAVIDTTGTPKWNGFFQRLWGAPGAQLAITVSVLITALSRASNALAEEGIDLTAMAGANEEVFNPYSFVRSRIWILLPAFALLLTLLHLKKYRMFSNRKRKE